MKSIKKLTKLKAKINKSQKLKKEAREEAKKAKLQFADLFYSGN